MKFFRIISLILASSLAIVCFAQEENTDAVYNKLTKEFVLHPDGTMEYHFRKELKLLTHFAFQRLFGETFIVFDSTYQELKFSVPPVQSERRRLK